nr:dol-P-Glc:Glc(2)Man(9)GlcNAc(2)-PP-Dol alpha-1,2-glucosyltransferase isoform X3 [Caretta caretta]
MERSEAYGFSAAISGTFLLACLLFSALNRQQRAPYMDEAFHVPQAQAYCEGLFQQMPMPDASEGKDRTGQSSDDPSPVIQSQHLAVRSLWTPRSWSCVCDYLG